MKTENELIAEFMAYNKYDTQHGAIDGNPNIVNYYNIKEIPSNSDGMDWHSQHNLMFDTSWDWLMPVVEKISQYVYETRVDNNGYKDVIIQDRAYPRTFGMIDSGGKWMVRINRMHLEQEDTLIKATYKSVVEFIKWYNENKQS